MCFACYQLLSATGISETLGKWAEVHLGKDKFKMRMKVDIVLCLLLMDYEEALQECAPSKISTCKQPTTENVLVLCWYPGSVSQRFLLLCLLSITQSQADIDWEAHLGKDKLKMTKKVDIVSCLLSMDCEEALHAIFLSLDGSSLAACSLVCKSWLWHCCRVRPVEAKVEAA